MFAVGHRELCMCSFQIGLRLAHMSLGLKQFGSLGFDTSGDLVPSRRCGLELTQRFVSELFGDCTGCYQFARACALGFPSLVLSLGPLDPGLHLLDHSQLRSLGSLASSQCRLGLFDLSFGLLDRPKLDRYLVLILWSPQLDQRIALADLVP